MVDCNSVEEVETRGKNYLLAKVLTSKYHNREVFKATMRCAWRSIKSLRFYDMGESLMMVEYENYTDKIKVSREGSWNLIVVKNFVGSQQVKNIKMVEESFWIRVYDLPLSARNEYIVGRLIGDSLG